MSEEKHTPGPWRIDDELSRAHKGYESGTRSVLAAELVIANTTRGWEDVAEAEANARLIAAAPDLLEALQELMAVWDPEWEPGKSLHAKARAAISKAATPERAKASGRP